MSDFDRNWLKSRGFFKKEIKLLVEKTEVYVDEENSLAFVTVSSNEKIDGIKKELTSFKVNYVWFFFNSNRFKVFRKTGDIKWFYYSSSMRPDFLQSRSDKLSHFSPSKISSLYDTRDIVNNFYDQLWETRIKMAKGCTQLENDGNKLLVVQHLIDRLIFFYFLAQLKLIKIKVGKDDWVLDRRHTRDFFDWIYSVLDDHQMQDFLNTVFFDTLGKIEEGGWSSSSFKFNGEQFAVTAPSLNGGLFLEKKIEGINERNIRINGLKALIKDTLNKYNWILGEEVPNEEDVIGDLTPEIIGHIYEKFVVSLEQIGISRINLKDVKTAKGKLRQGRRAIGAYYTPEEVTKFISISTIYPFIISKLEEKFGKDAKRMWDNFAKRKLSELEKEDLEFCKYFYRNVLNKITICDNACGSGSFLIAAGDVLLDLYNHATEIFSFMKQYDKEIASLISEMETGPGVQYHIVKQITTRNLYGVDFAEGAVEIAKLRFWLWLISQLKKDTVSVEPLPNLDFNLMTGNSLFGFISAEEKSTGKGSYLEFVKPKGKTKIFSKTKQLGFVKGSSATEIIEEICTCKNKYKIAYDPKIRNELRKKIEEKSKPLKSQLDAKLLGKLNNFGVPINEADLVDWKPFHWGFEFCGVFDSNKDVAERGFDILIGNPPWVFTRGEHFNNKEKKYFEYFLNERNVIQSKKGKNIQSGKLNLYSLFIIRSIDLMNKNSRFGFVIPNNILRTTTYDIIRKYILDNCRVLSIADLSCGVFDGVTASSIVLTFKKEPASNQRVSNNVSVISEISDLAQNDYSEHKIKQEVFYKNPSYTFNIHSDMKSIELSKKIKSNTVSLGSLCDYIIEGIVASRERDVADNKLNHFYKPFLVGKDISRYKIDYKGKWICYDRTRLHRARPEEVFLSNKILVQRISGGDRPLVAALDRGKYYTFASINNIVLKKEAPVSIKYVLALINSNILNWYYSVNFSNRSELTVNISKTFLQELPIKLIDHNKQQQVIDLVDKIMLLKEKSGNQANISTLEQSINERIYDLYGIKNDLEKQTIENKTS